MGKRLRNAFDAKAFLEKHPQYDWMTGLLKDRHTQPWTTFKPERLNNLSKIHPYMTLQKSI